MATSGTYTATQNVENIIVEAYERAGVDAQTLHAGHAITARRSLQFMFSDWDNRGVKQWTIDEQSFTVTQSDPTYTLATGTLDVLDVVRRDANDNDVPIALMSRTEYSNLNNKSQEGTVDRALVRRERDSVTMTLYYVPDNSTDRIVYWRIRSLQDITSSGEDADAPRRWWDAIAAGLAERLHMKRPAAERDQNWSNVLTVLRAQAKDALFNAMTEDRERADLGVYPSAWNAPNG